MRKVYFMIVLLLLVLPVAASGFDTLPGDVADFLATRRTLMTVTFKFGSAVLSEPAKAELKTIVDALRQAGTDDLIVRVEGFSSNDGDPGNNLFLSMDRARAVENFLTTLDVPSNRTLMGMGKDQWSKLSPEQQRRVDVAVYDNRFDGNNWETELYLLQ